MRYYTFQNRKGKRKYGAREVDEELSLFTAWGGRSASLRCVFCLYCLMALYKCTGERYVLSWEGVQDTTVCWRGGAPTGGARGLQSARCSDAVRYELLSVPVPKGKC
jgi:hypothetical protein